MNTDDMIRVGIEDIARDIVDGSCFKLFKGKKSNNHLNVTIAKKVRFIRICLQSLVSINLEKIILISNQRAITSEFHVFASSVYDDRFKPNNLVGPESDGRIAFHSKSEHNPWILICLSQEQHIDAMQIYNRDDEYYWRALSIKIDVSNDLIIWDDVHDNLAYKNSDVYQYLNSTEKAIVDCYAMQVDSVIRLIENTSKSNREQAINIHNKAKDLLNIRGCSLGPHGITQTFQDKNTVEINLAYSELSRLLNLINVGFDLNSFISSGTLLGAIRDGGFIGHDDDIDICYISKFNNECDILSERNELCRFLVKNGFSVLKNNDIAHVWVKSAAGIAFDLFTGWIEADNCIMNPLDINGVHVSSILPLKKWSNNNSELYIPNHAEDLLKLNYGQNWKIPDPFWKFDWSKAARDYQFLYGDLK